MKRSVILFALLPIFVCTACTFLESDKRTHAVEYVTEATNPHDYGDTFDWQNRSPLDFIAMLKQRSPSSPYMVLGIHKNWLRKSDIPELIALLDSTEPCAAVEMSTSSFIDFSGSSVGNEAAYLIKGYMQGEYPIVLSSSRFKVSKKDKLGLKMWWKNLPSETTVE